MREHESEHPRRHELVARIPGTIRASLVVVVDRLEETLSIVVADGAPTFCQRIIELDHEIRHCRATIARGTNDDPTSC